MYIVGTSGHIDHGKTALIKALTGTDCDRLPEEKKREMTIDIGFAKIEYPKFGTVSIVDVPGHERFIRNMVVGASGIDLALLVIAVDDSWMPQTEDHFRVIDLLGIERIIVVLNKIDLADDEMIEIVQEEVRERISDTRFRDADIVKTSSKTGFGIDELKTRIKKNLEQLSRVPNADKPYLFIDRVFESKGYGTIVTGTLKNGMFIDDDTVTILPTKQEVRIKRIESHNLEMHQGVPSQRTALNLSGVSLEQVKRGNIIVKNSFYTESDDIFSIIKLSEKKELKNNLGIELLIGTSSQKGKVILLETDNENEKQFGIPVRIKFNRPWFFYAGERFIITNPGGYRVIGGGTVVLPAYNSKMDKRSVKNHIHLLDELNTESIIKFLITIEKGIKKKDIIKRFPHDIKRMDKLISALIEEGSIKEIDNFIILKSYYENANNKIVDVINNNIGLNQKEISDLSGVDPDICRILIKEVLLDNAIIEKEGRYFTGDSVTVETLSEEKRKALSFIKSKGKEGIEFEKISDNALKKNVKDLIKMNFLISLDGNIVYDYDIYEDLKTKIMDLFDHNDKISLPQAKESTDLSRKYIIPLLNRIEGEGLIKRIGDFRIKA